MKLRRLVLHNFRAIEDQGLMFLPYTLIVGPNNKELRSALIGNGVLKTDAKGFRFTQDYTFSSPSTCAGVVLGRSANGRLERATKDGKTLKSIQESA